MALEACRESGSECHSQLVNLALPVAVLCRLLRERSLAASEFHYLDPDSHRAGRLAIKSSCSGSGPGGVSQSG